LFGLRVTWIKIGTRKILFPLNPALFLRVPEIRRPDGAPVDGSVAIYSDSLPNSEIPWWSTDPADPQLK
jgi:hypothetical protein